MADYLLGLTQRALGVANTLQPLIPSMFEAGLPMASDQTWDWQAEPLEAATEPTASPIAVPLSSPLSTQTPPQPESAIAEPGRAFGKPVDHSDSAFRSPPSTLPDPKIVEFARKSATLAPQDTQPRPLFDRTGLTPTEKKKD